jgi:hypothetical protein
MTEHPETVAVMHLNRAEALDLKRYLNNSGCEVSLEESSVDRNAVGVLDPVTLVVLPLATLAIKGVVAWLAKDRHEATIEQDVEIRRPDGTTERRQLRIHRSDAVNGEHVDDVVAALGAT